MNEPTEHTLDELFVRYWDNDLTEDEGAELQRRLADPVAREWFQLFCLQAVVAAELPVSTGVLTKPQLPQAETSKPPRRWSRRRVLRYLGGGIAACIAAGVLGLRRWSRQPASQARLTATQGTVTLQTASGQAISPTGFVPPGSTVSTHGPNSSAVVSYPDGVDISFTGDSVVTLTDQGRRLLLRQGSALADVPPQPADGNPLILATAEATLSRLSGVLLTLGCILQGTEVGVHRGKVTVADSAGEPLEVVRGGEILTVRADGNCRKKPMPETPDEFAWDLTRPLPSGWRVGRREPTPDGPVILPEFWFDPFHQAVMSQIRSDKQWAPGFFRLFPDSVIRVRYWVDRPGPSQLVIVVRTSRVADPATACVACNGAFAQARPREWQWLEVKAAAMLDNSHGPKFDAPWVGFLVIFNTYKEDLGLRVADFRVTRPGGAAPEP